MGLSQFGGDPGAPVTALGRESLIAQVLGHEFGPHVADGGDIQRAFLAGVRKPVARHGRSNNVEGVDWVSAVAGRVAEQGYDLRHLEECAGPTVGYHQRHGVGTLSLLVDEMDTQAIDIGLEMWEGVDQFLLGAPIELGAPVLHQLFDVI